MEILALSVAVASIVYTTISNVMKQEKSKYCQCPLCRHVLSLSDEAIKDITENALPESHEKK